MKKQYLIACILACSWSGAFASTTYDDNSESEPTVMVQRIEDEMGTDEALELLKKSLNNGPMELTPIALQVVNRRFGVQGTSPSQSIPFERRALYTFPHNLSISEAEVIPIGKAAQRSKEIKALLRGEKFYGFALEVAMTDLFTSYLEAVAGGTVAPHVCQKFLDSVPDVCFALVQHATEYKPETK